MALKIEKVQENDKSAADNLNYVDQKKVLGFVIESTAYNYTVYARE